MAISRTSNIHNKNNIFNILENDVKIIISRIIDLLFNLIIIYKIFKNYILTRNPTLALMR